MNTSTCSTGPGRPRDSIGPRAARSATSANVWYAAGLQAFFQPRRLAPDRLFAGVRRNLRARGVFFMVNHGPEEARIAAEYCSAAGLRQVG